MRDLILDVAQGREFELALRYCGLTEGRRGDREHHQPCPFCTGKDRFYFIAELGTFFCRRCGYSGNIISLMMATNALTFRDAVEILAAELGVILPDKQGKQRKSSKKQPASLYTIWEKDVNDAKMTIASLVLAHLRFVPATDGIDFADADIETTRKYAGRLVGYPLRDIIELLAIGKYECDTQKARIVLEHLYAGTNATNALAEINLCRSIQSIRVLAYKEHRELEKTIEYHLGVRKSLATIRSIRKEQ